MAAKCYKKCSDLGIDFDTWVGRNEQPECFVSKGFPTKHTVRMKNYRTGPVTVTTQGRSVGEHVRFKKDDTVDTSWSETVDVPPRVGAQPAVRRCEAPAEPNQTKPAKQEIIETKVSYVEKLNEIVLKRDIPALHHDIDIR